MGSLLGAIIGKFTNQFENVATEGLAHIIGSSEMVRKQLLTYLNTKFVLPEAMHSDFDISTQFSDSNDASIPDLALQFPGQQKLLIEVKFWAKLTKNQPLTYLQKLNQQNGECLFFLVPQQRIPILKNEIIQKMELEIGGKIAYEFSGNNIIFNDFASIGLLSWEELMGFLIERVDSTEPHLKADLDQLQQMILKMLSPDFLPFEVGDFDFNAYRKYTQMIELIDATVDANPNYNTKNLSYGGGRNSFQRWFLIGDYYTAGLELHARYWEEHAHPIWLVLYGSTWQNKGKVPFPEMSLFEAKIKEAELDFLVISENGYRKLVFPISIPFGQDKETCLLEIQKQMNKICSYLPERR
jgi:hypothetical protein